MPATIRKLEREISTFKHDYNSRISTALDELKTEAERVFHNAEYEGLGDQVSIELLKEMRNQEKAEELIKSYKGKEVTLQELAQKEVDMNSPYAPAYIKGLLRN